MLAGEAGLSAPATSAHLNKLRSGGLIEAEASGRHRYYRLSGSQVAAVLESLATIAPFAPVRSLRQATRAAALRATRSCYDHLAGRLGVAVTAALVEREVLVATDGIVRHHPSSGRTPCRYVRKVGARPPKTRAGRQEPFARHQYAIRYGRSDPDLDRKVRRAAAAKGESVSEFLRRWAWTRTRPPGVVCHRLGREPPRVGQDPSRPVGHGRTEQ